MSMATSKPAPSTITTALIYTRVSSDEQAREGISLDAQLHECRQYAARQGWLLGPEYQDVMSGTRDDRPQYQALLTEVRRLRAEGHRVVVIVAALDRFGRKLLERVRCREELKLLSVATHSVRDGGEVNDLVANVLAAVAQEEVRRLGERVSHAKRHVIAAGWHPGGCLPWGYQLRDATPAERAAGAPRRVAELNPLTAPYALEMFTRVARGESIRAVTRWVLSLPAPLREQRALTYSTVRSSLTTATYIGRAVDGRSGRWPALVDLTTWAAAQARIADHQHMPKQASGRYLLTGLLRCPRCHQRMNGRLVHGGRRRVYLAYYCSQEKNSACCFTAVVTPINAAVLAEVGMILDTALSADRTLRTTLQREWKALQRPQDDSADTQARHRLERMAAQARQRLTRAAELYADGALDRAGYELLRDKAYTELGAATAELERLRPAQQAAALPPLETVLAALSTWADALHSTDTMPVRDVLGNLIDHVVPIRTGRGRYQVDVAWTPLGAALHEAVAVARRETAA
jgi:site-specific DNA recombinase